MHLKANLKIFCKVELVHNWQFLQKMGGCLADWHFAWRTGACCRKWAVVWRTDTCCRKRAVFLVKRHLLQKASLCLETETFCRKFAFFLCFLIFIGRYIYNTTGVNLEKSIYRKNRRLVKFYNHKSFYVQQNIF